MKSHALASFWKCYKQLPQHAQELADKNFALLKANSQHPSLGFKRKGGVYTVEVGRSYRAIARERLGATDQFLLRNGRVRASAERNGARDKPREQERGRILFVHAAF